MSVQSADGRWVVRWRDAFGRQRGRRFQTEQSAKEFDAAIHDVAQQERRGDGGARAGGVYAYSTKTGTRWYFKTRASNGAQLTRRGFSSQKAASDAKRRLVEQIERREIRHTKATFGEHWQIWLKSRKPHLQHGTWRSYEIIGRKRLLPAFESLPLARLTVEHVRAWMDEQARAVAAGKTAPKTANNTRGTLVACLNAAVHDGLIASNPALAVERLPDHHIEREYLRLHEIPVYLNACSETYRPLAELLIGGGLRISEATALRVRDLELNDDGGTVVVCRSRKHGQEVGSTKSGELRAVEIGQGLSQTLRDHVSRRAKEVDGDLGSALLYVMPARERNRPHARRRRDGAEEPIDRVTVSRDWHKHALQNAELRDMPLHALRHTAAAASLAAGNSLRYVQHQLGHASTSTTSLYYGHLERHVLTAGATATEKAIERAARKAK